MSYKILPVEENRDIARIIGIMIQDSFRNCLLLGDLNAPMNQLTDAFKIVDESGEIVSGFTIFNGVSPPVVIFPHAQVEFYKLIQSYVDSLELPAVQLSFPIELEEGSAIPSPPPWLGWGSYIWTHQFTDIAMRFTKQELEVMALDEELPTLRVAKKGDAEKIQNFFREVVDIDDPSIGHWFIPEQLESEMSVIAEDKGKMVGFGGTHFETPYTVQLGNIYVSKEYRGKGLGKAITTAVTLGVIRTKRVPTLFVNESNTTALNLYRSLGYESYNRFSFYLGRRG